MHAHHTDTFHEGPGGRRQGSRQSLVHVEFTGAKLSEESLATGADQDARSVLLGQTNKVVTVREHAKIVLHGFAKTDTRVQPQLRDPESLCFVGDAAKEVTDLLNDVLVRRVVLHDRGVTLSMHGDVGDAEIGGDGDET